MDKSFSIKFEITCPQEVIRECYDGLARVEAAKAANKSDKVDKFLSLFSAYLGNNTSDELNKLFETMTVKTDTPETTISCENPVKDLASKAESFLNNTINDFTKKIEDTLNEEIGKSKINARASPDDIKIVVNNISENFKDPEIKIPVEKSVAKVDQSFIIRTITNYETCSNEDLILAMDQAISSGQINFYLNLVSNSDLEKLRVVCAKVDHQAMLKIIDDLKQDKIIDDVLNEKDEIDDLVTAAREDTNKKNYTKKANGKKNKAKKNKQPDVADMINNPDFANMMKNFDPSKMTDNLQSTLDKVIPMLNEFKPVIMNMVNNSENKDKI